MSPVVTGLIGAVLSVVLVAVAVRTQPGAKADEAGWKRLRPGWLLNGTIVLSAGLALLMLWVILFVGSSRPDAATQMVYAAILAAAFGAGAVYTAWAGYGRAIMWKGDTLRIRSRSGGETVRRLSDVVEVVKSESIGEYRLRFRDGSRLRFSAYLSGANELAERLPRAK